MVTLRNGSRKNIELDYSYAILAGNIDGDDPTLVP